MDKIKTTQTEITATTNNNVSLTWAGNNTAISLGQSGVISSSFKLYNNGTIVNEGSATVNYTLTDGAVTIINQTIAWSGTAGSGAPNTLETDTLNASFDYKFPSAARNTSTSGLAGVNTMAEFIPTISVVAIAGILIGIILIFFGRKNLI